MTPEEAYGVLTNPPGVNIGRFYGQQHGLSVGAGVICRNLRYPKYDATSSLFATVRGLILVVSHECDISDENKRPFNDDVLVCPLLKLEDSLTELAALKGPLLRDFLLEVARRGVQRVLFFPALPGVLEFGGFLMVNQISATKLSAFGLGDVQIVGALSAFGLREVDSFFQNALFRPKAEPLAFEYRYEGAQ